ncbi:restriction endonuclease subunit S [Streptococcus sanguinis]|uniref:restriction endonuclease subunit S n=1 Tax=Streptococcus sanguinis TaxID=1305 RepID=UPI001D13CC6A|nr:restriction endonuclease subunit S [Streptococcus sanguinis]MCC3166873.1 type I restriction modification DNA specificity domain protein [Streptococcus sanguinis]
MKPYEKFADGSIKEFKHNIPKGWTIVYLPDICALEDGSIKRGPFGSSITKSMFVPKGENTYKVYEQGNAIRKTIDYGDYWLKESDYLRLKNFSIKAGDILISCAGTIGEIFQIPSNYYDGVINQALLKLTLNPDIIDSQYFKWMFMSLINTVKKEQQRIVEAIESALEKVDEYAESYNRLEQLDKEFPDKLKKSILQYAMQGKLVEQDSNDESVEVLLEKIRAEKQKLFKEGKIKKKDLEISIVSQGDDNSPYGNKDETTSYPVYEIPEAWRYIKFASLVNFRIGKTPPRSEATFWGTEIPWVSISDMPISGYVTNTRESISKLALKSKKIDISPKGTLLMSFKLSIGKVAILDIPATHNEAIISIFPYANKENIIRDYLMIFLPLISTSGNSKDAIKGKTLNSTSISELLIPISNHEEMRRIISKVDLLFQKVSQL